MLINFNKSFDSLESRYIERGWEKYNFSISLKGGVECYIQIPRAVLSMEGTSHLFFRLGRGCRQGDPLSPYIFILAVEPLAMALKNNPKITGIEVKGIKHVLGQYADDTFIFLDGSESSLKETLKCLDKFQYCSGLKTNVDKTKLAWLGVNSFSLDRLCPHVKLKWVTEFKLLGIKFHVDLEKMPELNYNSKLGEIEQLLSLYQKRYLSLIGKSTVIKTLAIPKIVHLLSVLPAPPKTFRIKLENVFKNFLWNNKKRRLSYQQLCKGVDEGGIKLTHIDTLTHSLKIAWIKRLLETRGSWQDMFRSTITQEVEQIWELDLASLEAFSQNTSNKFWKEVFISWKWYRSHASREESEFFPIWNSSFCTTNGIIKNKKMLQKMG